MTSRQGLADRIGRKQRVARWAGLGAALSSLALMVVVVAAPAHSAPAKKPAEPTVSEKGVKADANAGSAEVDSKAARERDEARQQAWDKKMKALTGSICTGC
jgi:hypothetical protein